MANKYKLTELQLRALKPRSTSYMVSDGAGLNIKVYPNGRAQWVLRKTSMGKAYQHYLGDYPEVSLKEARALASEQASAMADGRHADRPPQFSCLRDLADDFLANRKVRPNTIRNDRNALKNLSCLMSRPIDNITTLEARSHLMNLSRTSGPTAARHAAEMLNMLEKHAYALGLIETPRFSLLTSTLPRHSTTHIRSVHADEFEGLVKTIKANERTRTSLHMSRLLLLCYTLLRSHEARHMSWDMVDFESMVITIPVSLMKAKREHRVPVCSQLDYLLHNVIPHEGEYVLSSRGTRVSDGFLNATFASLGIIDLICPHGVRSMARSWFADQGLDFAAAELCLAHRVENATQQSYQRSDYLEQRRAIMQAWGDYVDSCVRPYFPHLLPPLTGSTEA